MRSHVAAPSAVCHTATDCDWHCAAGEPGAVIQPSRSFTNEMSPFATSGVSGRFRSSHVAPRSVDRKRRVPPTSVHTTSALGALRSANVGSEIGLFDGLGAGVLGAGVGDGVAVAAGVDVTDADGEGEVAAGDEHAAARTR